MSGVQRLESISRLGVPVNTPAVRWNPKLPAFIHAVRYASKGASHNPDWICSTQIFTHLADEPSPIGIRPVFRYGNLIGHLISMVPVSRRNARAVRRALGI